METEDRELILGLGVEIRKNTARRYMGIELYRMNRSLPGSQKKEWCSGHGVFKKHVKLSLAQGSCTLREKAEME